jgi:hypothetical protein
MAADYHAPGVVKPTDAKAFGLELVDSVSDFPALLFVAGRPALGSPVEQCVHAVSFIYVLSFGVFQELSYCAGATQFDRVDREPVSWQQFQ